MENQELLLLELEEFDRSNQIDKQIPQSLESFIEYVAKTGTYIFPWNKIKKLYMRKINQSIEHFSQTQSIDAIPNFDNSLFNELKIRILDRIKSFNNAPFTIQRISELLLKPQCNYSRIDKYLRGLEKCVMVVTTVDSLGNKIFTEAMVNGCSNDSTSINGDFYQKHSLHIETLVDNSEDRLKFVKQSKIDFTEIEAKLPIATTTSIEDIELKIEREGIQEAETEKPATVTQQETPKEESAQIVEIKTEIEEVKTELKKENENEKNSENTETTISNKETIKSDVSDPNENNIDLVEEKGRSSDEAMDN